MINKDLSGRALGYPGSVADSSIASKILSMLSEIQFISHSKEEENGMS